MTTASMKIASCCLTWSGRPASCWPTMSSASQWYKSDAVPGADLLAGDALVRWRRPVGLVAVHPSEELALRVGIAPGVSFEPPAPDRLHQRGQVLVVACLLEGCVQFVVVALQDLRVGVGRQDCPDRGGRARRTIRDERATRLRRCHGFQYAPAVAPAQRAAGRVEQSVGRLIAGLPTGLAVCRSGAVSEAIGLFSELDGGSDPMALLDNAELPKQFPALLNLVYLAAAHQTPLFRRGPKRAGRTEWRTSLSFS